MLGYMILWFVVCAAAVPSLLGRHDWRLWISRDVLLPEILVVIVAAAVRVLAPGISARSALFTLLAATWLAATMAAAAAIPWLRRQAMDYLRQLRARSLRPAG